MGMTQPTVQGSMQASGSLANALMNLFSQLVSQVFGSQTVDKNGNPIREVCYMQMPLGIPVDPRQYSNPWTPAGGDTMSDFTTSGQFTPPQPAPSSSQPASSTGTSSTPAKPAPPQPDPQMMHSLQSAYETAVRFDRMLRITSDGTYRPYEGGETVSSTYQAIMLKAQGVPAPPPPADIQAQIDKARSVLWDKPGVRTANYQQYEKLSQAWAAARTAYATAEAQTMTDPAAAEAWPVTSSTLQQNVDNAWNDWRSAGADEIENALDTLGAVGGSVGDFFVSQSREVFKAWDLGLSGVVPVGTPYTEISPATWYDPNDSENGFMGLTASDSQWQSSSSTSSSSMAANWYQGQTSSTGGGGMGMVFGVTFGAEASSTSSSDSSGGTQTGSQFYGYSNSMSDVSISLEFGLCDIFRPWLLNELFVIDGWYLPNEPAHCISDGTVANQKDPNDTHYFPMLPTQFLVVRNVKITASGWGDAGTQLSSYVQNQQSSDQSSSTSVSGGVGFLGFGGEVSHSNADWSGQDSQSASAAGSWYYEEHGQTGTLTINGCQIVAWVGEVIPASPKIPDPALANKK